MIKPWIFDIFTYHTGTGFTPSECQRVYDEYLDRWAAAEERGFEGVFFSEHHFSTFNLSPSPNLLIAATAQRTTSLRLGVMCNVVPLNDPRRLAEEFGMLYYLTRGRLEVGLGMGSGTAEALAAGLDPTQNRARYLSGLALIGKALRQPHFTHQDEFTNIVETPLVPRPGADLPPIWVTCLGTFSAQVAAHSRHRVTTAWLPIDDITAVFDAYRNAAGHDGWEAGPEQFGIRRRVWVAQSQAEAEDTVAQSYDAFLEGSLEGDDPKVKDLLTKPDDFAVGTAEFVADSLIDQAQRSGCGNILMWTDFRLFPQGAVDKCQQLIGERVIPALRSAKVG